MYKDLQKAYNIRQKLLSGIQPTSRELIPLLDILIELIEEKLGEDL